MSAAELPSSNQDLLPPQPDCNDAAGSTGRDGETTQSDSPPPTRPGPLSAAFSVWRALFTFKTLVIAVLGIELAACLTTPLYYSEANRYAFQLQAAEACVILTTIYAVYSHHHLAHWLFIYIAYNLCRTVYSQLTTLPEICASPDLNPMLWVDTHLGKISDREHSAAVVASEMAQYLSRAFFTVLTEELGSHLTGSCLKCGLIWLAYRKLLDGPAGASTQTPLVTDKWLKRLLVTHTSLTLAASVLVFVSVLAPTGSYYSCVVHMFHANLCIHTLVMAYRDQWSMEALESFFHFALYHSVSVFYTGWPMLLPPSINRRWISEDEWVPVRSSAEMKALLTTRATNYLQLCIYFELAYLIYAFVGVTAFYSLGARLYPTKRFGYSFLTLSGWKFWLNEPQKEDVDSNKVVALLFTLLYVLAALAPRLLLGWGCGCDPIPTAFNLTHQPSHDMSEFPWLARLERIHHPGMFCTCRNTFCSASVISPQHLLTAAHCGELIGDGSSIYDEVEAVMSDGARRRINSTHIRLHPEFTGEPIMRYDIAVVELGEPLVLANAVAAGGVTGASVSAQHSPPLKSVRLAGSGWGARLVTKDIGTVPTNKFSPPLFLRRVYYAGWGAIFGTASSIRAKKGHMAMLMDYSRKAYYATMLPQSSRDYVDFMHMCEKKVNGVEAENGVDGAVGRNDAPQRHMVCTRLIDGDRMGGGDSGSPVMMRAEDDSGRVGWYQIGVSTQVMDGEAILFHVKYECEWIESVTNGTLQCV